LGSVQQLISWALDNQPTINPPGSTFAYSHFGYSILGRVIEKITGLPYAQAVQSLVLQPSGISDMQIAENGLAQRAPNEIKYYDQSGNNSAYSFNINRMDATNGWLASATDLARFLVHVDGLSSETILSQNAINVMSTGSTANPKYGCGWELNQFNWYHHGTLPGTGTSQAITTQNGNFNYVIWQIHQLLIRIFPTIWIIYSGHRLTILQCSHHTIYSKIIKRPYYSIS
jgi:D-alanyl-D-alanine carboxypeptidase